MNNWFPLYWRSISMKRPASLSGRVTIRLLLPISAFYSLITRFRAYLYENKILRRKRLPRPVISIGNLTVGGTGKTPVSAYLADKLMKKGVKVALLSRGYKGNMEGETAIVSDGEKIFLSPEECGDEPFLLASSLSGAIVATGVDRHEAGIMSMKHFSPDIFLIDDGYQHLKLHRDMDILLLDYANPFGNGLTLPAGALREPLSAIRRASIVILTRAPADKSVFTESGNNDPYEKEADSVLRLIGEKPSCTASYRIKSFESLAKTPSLSPEELKGTPLFAFAGIADPKSFFEELKLKGLNIVGEKSFPDHFEYNSDSFSALSAAMRSSGARFLVTTEKDGVKLKKWPPGSLEKILLAKLEITISPDSLLEEMLVALLRKNGL